MSGRWAIVNNFLDIYLIIYYTNNSDRNFLQGKYKCKAPEPKKLCLFKVNRQRQMPNRPTL